MTAKQVFVVRRDLKCRRGKEIAQTCHAATKWLLDLYNTREAMSKVQQEWIWNDGQTKICVQVHSEQELLDIHQAALNAGLISHLITDAGRTEFNGVPTKTCLAIGPDDSVKIDKITGHLALY